MQCRHLVAAGFALIFGFFFVIQLVSLPALHVNARAVAPPPRQQSSSDGSSGAGTTSPASAAPRAREHQPVPRLLLGSVGENWPYLDPATNWLYVNCPGVFAILDARNGTVIRSVKTRKSKAPAYSNVVPFGSSMVCSNDVSHLTTCRDRRTLAQIWEFKASGPLDQQTPPFYVEKKNAVLLGNYKNREMYKLNADTGKLQATGKLPRSKVFDRQHPSLWQKHNLLFVGSQRFVAALNADTLDVEWMYETGIKTKAKPGVLSLSPASLQRR